MENGRRFRGRRTGFGIVAVLSALAILVGGCATGMTDQDVQHQIALWQGAVAIIDEANLDATVAMTLETDEMEAALKQGVGWRPPVRARLSVSTNIKGRD